jgi:hypothetical protein
MLTFQNLCQSKVVRSGMTPRDFISDLMPWSGTLLLVYAGVRSII